MQSLYDGLGPGAGASTASFRLLLCGSAISVMADLLSGTRALRGRAALELRVRSFGYRDAREYWGIEDPAAAFAHNALVGGTPGYRELVPDPQVPEGPAQLGGWLTRRRGAVWRRPGELRKRDSRKMCYCENVKNITVSVPDDVYRNARVTAAQRDTSVSALVVAYLEQLSGRIDEFARLETLQHEVQAGIRQFRASDRMSRDEVHDRAVR